MTPCPHRVRPAGCYHVRDGVGFYFGMLLALPEMARLANTACGLCVFYEDTVADIEDACCEACIRALARGLA